MPCIENSPRRGAGLTCRVSEHCCAGNPPTASMWLRVPYPLWAFALLPNFPVNDCYFTCVSSHIPVLPFPPALPPIPCTFRFVQHSPFQNPVVHARSRSFLQRTSFHIPRTGTFLSCTSIFFLPPFLILYFPFRSHTFCVCSALPLPKSCWACTLQVPSPAYFLLFTFPSRISLYCGFYLYCVCNVFFFTFCFTKFSWNMLNLTIFFLLIWFLFIQCCSFLLWIWCISYICLHFCLNLVWYFKGVICH